MHVAGGFARQRIYIYNVAWLQTSDDISRLFSYSFEATMWMFKVLTLNIFLWREEGAKGSNAHVWTHRKTWALKIRPTSCQHVLWVHQRPKTTCTKTCRTVKNYYVATVFTRDMQCRSVRNLSKKRAKHKTSENQINLHVNGSLESEHAHTIRANICIQLTPKYPLLSLCSHSRCYCLFCRPFKVHYTPWIW